MVAVDIVDWAESSVGFYVDRRWTGSRWALEHGPIRLAEYHQRILRHCFTPRDADGRLPYDVVAWCEPAKSGKSAVAALVAEFFALHIGQNSTVVMASNKQNQAASLMFKSLVDSVEYNPHLPRVDPTRYAVEFRNGNTVRAIASNSRGEAGARFSLALFDELWGYVHQDAERLWAEFKTDPTRINSVKMAVGVAGYHESKLWLETLNTGLAGAPIPDLADIVNTDGTPTCWQNGRHFMLWSHVCRQPWQTDAWVESQRKALRPAEFERMIMTQFVASVGDFLPTGVWESLVDPAHHPLTPGSRQPIFVGLDVATAARGDDCALAGCYPDNGKVKLAFHRVWKGSDRRQQLKLGATVEPCIELISKCYNLAGVFYDEFQAIQLAERLRNKGIRCVPVPQTHSSRGPKDTTLWQLAVNGDLVLYPDPELESAAAYASAKELPDGRLFLTKGGGRRGKIDLLVALSNCADEARRGTRAYIY